MPFPIHPPKFVVATYRRLQPFLEWLPFTTGGALFCASSALAVWFFGVQRSDFILIVIGAVGLLISLLSVLFTLGFGAVLWRRYRYLDTDSFLLRVGETHKVDIPIAVAWWMPLIQVSWHWMNAEMKSESEENKEVLVPTRRGVWSNIESKDSSGRCIWNMCDSVHIYTTLYAQSPSTVFNSITTSNFTRASRWW